MMTYDSGNMWMGNEDPVDFLKAVAPRVVHAHAKDWERLPDDADTGLFDRSGRKYAGTRVGLGVLDYPAIIGALKALDYQGFLAFEYEGSGDQLSNALEGCAFLRDLI
jgi:sugar phosphate isomerase/epimerase